MTTRKLFSEFHPEQIIEVLNELTDNLCSGDSLRSMREEAAMPQQVLADLAGVKQQTVSHIETGKIKPSAIVALKFYAILRGDAEWVCK